MRIAFLSFYSGHVDRGVEVATAALAAKLSKKHEVTVFQSGERIFPHVNTIQIPVETTWSPDSSKRSSRILYFDYYSKKIAQFTFKFLPYFLRYRYDVIIPTNGGWQVVICRVISWLLGKKMIVQGNAGIGRDDFWNLLSFPNRFIAISPQGFAWAKKRAPWIRNRYIPYGVDLDLFRSAKPIEIKLKNPIVLCVAAFIPLKRIDLLISAMQQVKNASLLVIGQGIEQQKLENLGKKLLGKRFLLKTGVTHDMLPAYYKSARVFSLPSKSTEALGIVQIEAMAAGLPVVATDDMNRRDIIGDAGILVNPEDKKTYAQALEKALNSDFDNKPQKQAQSYSWHTVGQKYEELFENL